MPSHPALTGSSWMNQHLLKLFLRRSWNFERIRKVEFETLSANILEAYLAVSTEPDGAKPFIPDHILNPSPSIGEEEFNTIGPTSIWAPYSTVCCVIYHPLAERSIRLTSASCLLCSLASVPVALQYRHYNQSSTMELIGKGQVFIISLNKDGFSAIELIKDSRLASIHPPF